jgi:hypothetical protein
MYSAENTVSYIMQNKYKNVRIINTTDEVECHIFTKIFYETVESSIYHNINHLYIILSSVNIIMLLCLAVSAGVKTNFYKCWKF